MRDNKQPATVLNTLHDLNSALLKLTPSITGIDTSMLQVPGITIAMLNAEIAANTAALWDGMQRPEVINALKPGLINRVNTTPITMTYDVHGDKHFPGGQPGTKFPVAAHQKAQVNTAIRALIDPVKGRIRRDAKGKNQTYYLTERPTTYTGAMSLVVQVDYIASPESIGYHGYPSANVPIYTISRTLGGVAIAI
ncbi:hypothetical protein [Polymorphobacter megasporae]|uniref:hypothetical protein n=1 Tax=Glacieibacterium megasporae TaxID=2835787 RepID=UPI001C1E1240|nr:hypothetical protein [Polymorphobacter megasporae]UAJ08652.1 hypothetical protein KTC28_09570 [Polymorphobacter megasporae]